MFPTISDAASLTIPGDRPIDGVSFWSTLQEKPGRRKPWIYIWYQGKVLGRTKTRMVRRMNQGGSVAFLDCSSPYEERTLEVGDLDEKDKAAYETLLGVIRDLDKTRSTELKK